MLLFFDHDLLCLWHVYSRLHIAVYCNCSVTLNRGKALKQLASGNQEKQAAMSPMETLLLPLCRDLFMDHIKAKREHCHHLINYKTAYRSQTITIESTL